MGETWDGMGWFFQLLEKFGIDGARQNGGCTVFNRWYCSLLT